MNIANSLPSTVSGISFSFLSTEDVRRVSVKQIVNPVLLDDLNRPTFGGLYDPALGPSDRQDICSTCRLTYFTCPGHFGHIELPAPVFHPLFMQSMYTLLRGTCLFCHRFKMSRTVLSLYIAKFRLLEHGFLDAALGVDDLRSQARQKRTDEEESTEETPEEFQLRVDLFVKIHLGRASGSKRDHYKDGLVYQTRKELITEFLKATVLRKCYNEGCSAHGYTFRKEGHTKIIEYDLSRKQKIIHSVIHLKRPDVLLQQKQDSLSNGSIEERGDASDSDADMTESEMAGDPTFSEEDPDESELAESVKESQLPKAANGKTKTSRGRNERVMAPEECRAHLRRLFQKEAHICSLIFGRHGPFAAVSPAGLSFASADMFFLEAILVTPTRFRPPAKLGETLFEHPQNEMLAKILNTSYRLRDINAELRTASQQAEGSDEATRRNIFASLLDALVQLQVDVNSFMDSSKNPTPMRQGKLPTAGVKQGLEKKEGLFRKHMMGKRVNYAARSVISPDVLIEPNEIGVPPVFARKLTFPEPVTPANFHELRQLVITGPRGYPGATIVEYEDGTQLSLANFTVEQRTAIADQLLTPQKAVRASSGRRGLCTRTSSINKKVYRHLRDGDMLLVNRQPTLHKPSMMAHKARVLQGEKTIRMHYANCNSYNADFDGDEMNLHFPQNQIARAEAMFIANTENQYLVPTSGKPLRGLIQDHVVAGVWMTCQDTFFTRDEYCQLLYGALRPEEEPQTEGLVMLPPSIWKPTPLWTGKQMISTVLKNITPSNAEGLNLGAKAKVPGHFWGKDSTEDEVVFVGGELLCGVLDKSAFGATEFGLVHSVYELYGADVAGKLLGILSRLFTKFLQHRAFTCRMDDLALTPDGNKKRANILQEGRDYGTEGAIENFPSLADTPKSEVPTALTSLLEEVLRDDTKMAGLDVTVKTKLAKLTKSIADACIPTGLLRQFPHNNMQTMTLSGAKGSAVNAQQISCALGQQELEGRRVPVMVSGKTLPSFRPFETRAIAGGYVGSRFLTGVKPQEFYFHCMAGREGLIDTAVKTSRSGYLQRCLIKHLEGIRVHYDHTVRGSDSSVYQFHYGGDALDVTKQTHLYQFDFFARNELSLVNRYQPRSIEGLVDAEEALEYTRKILKKSRNRTDKHKPAKRDKYPPALSKYNPSRYLGSTSEKFAESLEEYIKSNPGQLLKPKGAEVVKNTRRQPLMSSRNFRLLLNFKYMRSLVEPGEAVGLLASQGIGEPSTQMTLNTFHFAGHGAANVTLGIPRLREIVMTASQKPKTPSMTMQICRGTSHAQVDAFCKRASRLTLSQVVNNVTVTETLVMIGEARRRRYTVDITFFPKAEYEQEYIVELSEILAAFASKFPLRLKKEIRLEMKQLDADLKSQIAELGKGKKPEASTEEAGEDDANDETTPAGHKEDDDKSEIGDGDAEESKRARQRKQQASYESDDEGEADDFREESPDTASISDVEGSVDGTIPKLPRHKNETSKQVNLVGKLFTDNLPQATAFKFNESACSFQVEFGDSMPKLLLVGIIERTCRKTIIREIPGIVDCFRLKEENEGKIQITTNGSNLHGFWDFSAKMSGIVENDEVYSNDIYAILKTYGVEMARAAILQEISNVFGAYKINVNIRHLELIADYMTFEGGYKPFNRKGLSTNPSPLLKASFETTTAFLSDATLYGDFDDLTTPSGKIVLGRPNLIGTGAFDVVMPV